MNKLDLNHPDKSVKVLGIRDIRGRLSPSEYTDKKFTRFIRCLLTFGNLKDSDIDRLLDSNGIRLYEQGFTHESIHPTFNYEHLEFLGDLTLNKAIPWILFRRYPQLCQPRGVKVLSRLKINLISKQVFSGLADRLHFLPFISSDLYTRNYMREDLLEDVFEAFFASTEILCDSKFSLGIGYHVCYTIIDKLLQFVPISLKYEDLYDAKTRLKELFDAYRDALGKEKYRFTKRGEDDQRPIFMVDVYSERDDILVLGHGEHTIKIEAEKVAAEQAIALLRSQGYIKEIPKFYQEILRPRAI